MNDKVTQLRSLVSAFESGAPVRDELQALGSEKLTQLREELEEQIRMSKESGGTVLPEKLATLEGLRGLMTDLVHGTLQSYFMDTLIDAQEERLRLVTEEGNTPSSTPVATTAPKQRRTSSGVSAFDVPTTSTPPSDRTPVPSAQGKLERFWNSASNFFRNMWGSVTAFFGSFMKGSGTPSSSPTQSEAQRAYDEDPPAAPAPAPSESPSSSQSPTGGHEPEAPTLESETSGGAPPEAQDLLTGSVDFEGHTIELSHDLLESFLTIDGVSYAAKKGFMPIGGMALRTAASSLSLSPEGGLAIGMGENTTFVVSTDELRRILGVTRSSTNESIPLTITYTNQSGLIDTFEITLNRKQ